jgi:hypothetical protein
LPVRPDILLSRIQALESLLTQLQVQVNSIPIGTDSVAVASVVREIVKGSPAIPAASQAWPIGSVYASVLTTNPGILLGVGSWTLLGNIHFATSPTEDLTGTHKSGYPNSAYLVDSVGRNLSNLGVAIGQEIYNTTKGESAIITAIQNKDATNDRVDGTLAGGEDWDEGDAFEVPLSQYGIIFDSPGTTVYFWQRVG